MRASYGYVGMMVLSSDGEEHASRQTNHLQLIVSI